MLLTTIHAQEGYQVRQILAVIDLLEEFQLGASDREYRYAGMKKDKNGGRKTSFVTNLQPADLMAHFSHTGSASLSIINGELHLTYTAKTNPYDELINDKNGLLPNAKQLVPF